MSGQEFGSTGKTAPSRVRSGRPSPTTSTRSTSLRTGRIIVRRLLLGGSGPIDLFLHRGAPRLERRRQPLRLLFQVVAALAEQVADVALRFPGLLLRLLQELAATLDEVLARLLAAPGR